MDAAGRPVLLRGVNLSGMEYSSQPFAGVTPDELTTIVRGWGANVVRIPFVQARVLASGDEGGDYVEELRQIVDWLAALGAYSILDLQWLDRETIWGPGENRVPPRPDEQSPDCWAKLSEAFRGTPHVLFDLLNEPHDIDAEEWNAWAARLAAAVRAADQDRVLLVSGVGWGYDLRGVWLEAPNVIYSTHVYPWMSLDWWNRFGFRTEAAPVFAGEWGGEAGHTAWGRQLAAYFDQLGMGWTAWSWRDKPHLQREGIPTEFGDVVFEALGGRWRTSAQGRS